MLFAKHTKVTLEENLGFSNLHGPRNASELMFNKRFLQSPRICPKCIRTFNKKSFYGHDIDSFWVKPSLSRTINMRALGFRTLTEDTPSCLSESESWLDFLPLFAIAFLHPIC